MILSPFSLCECPESHCKSPKQQTCQWKSAKWTCQTTKTRFWCQLQQFACLSRSRHFCLVPPSYRAAPQRFVDDLFRKPLFPEAMLPKSHSKALYWELCFASGFQIGEEKDGGRVSIALSTSTPNLQPFLFLYVSARLHHCIPTYPRCAPCSFHRINEMGLEEKMMGVNMLD